MKLNKYWPIAIFFAFFTLLVGVVLYYAPSWGLQDDFQSLDIAKTAWQSDNILENLWNVIVNDLASWGIFRPVYYASVVITYHFLKDVPWLIYILLVVFNFSAMFLWGVVITRLFNVRENFSRQSVFLFPLSFLIFTPFWNLFVHISFQEKYIVLFSAFFLYFLEKVYSREKLVYLLPATFFMILGIFSKPTGIYLAMASITFAVTDLAFLKYKKRISLWVLLVNTALFVLYYWFITSNLRGYAGQYSLSITSILNSLLASSIVIKFLIVSSLIMGIWLFILILRKKNNFSPLALMIPFGFLSYVLILAPWRLVNYLLSALTPYALIMFFPVYMWLNRKSKMVGSLTNACLIILVIISFSYIAVPRIAKLSDIKNVRKYILDSDISNNVYFFPPPFSEAADSISKLTKAKVIFLDNGILTRKKLQGNKKHYLIVNDEASKVQMKGVEAGEVVYQNKTWKVFNLKGSNQMDIVFKIDFPENRIEQLKTFLRDLK